MPANHVVEACGLLEQVIDLKRERAELREQITILIGLIADQACDNFLLRRVAEREIWLRVTTDGLLERYRQRARASRSPRVVAA